MDHEWPMVAYLWGFKTNSDFLFQYFDRPNRHTLALLHESKKRKLKRIGSLGDDVRSVNHRLGLPCWCGVATPTRS
ncbi:hypothetical protein [Enterococcus lactis]|uniref:hypothetical protein n=1 Tax=Enterococcus lactis TaxID=357441 RepID=UPI001BCFE028|nr:hypothetical protein [Enterococcus lactis]